ncbi:MAG TPA: phosphoglycerate dehydrogenase, partial [Thermoleophilia bacterium]|nr:phosphoglycerate dehydrogenase [Thermoleophilia bacterium]
MAEQTTGGTAGGVKRVLIKEKLAPEGIKYLEEQGFAVDVGTEWDADELLARIKDYHGLIIRSATKVTAEVIAAADNLQVVGRAGVGVDNVDVKAATRRGITVVNAPQSNVLSAAEHTIALMMACARNIPQAHADLKAGKWEKAKWGKGGVELQEKVLGIIGLGRIGFLVAERARGLKMKVIAYDPYVPAERFHELGLERADSPDRIYREADFITVHLPKNAETIGFVDDAAFAQMKDGVRVINVARGGIIDEEAWARAVESGKVAASAVDVYPKEPTTECPLFKYESVVSTPHLGASTVEAQLRAGMQVAEQVALVLKGQFAPNAVNIPLVPGEEADELMPYLALCEMLGKLVVQVADEPVDAVDITYEGVIGRYDTRILTLAVLQGMLADKVEGPVNAVNVAAIAEERGLSAREIKKPAAVDFLNVITVSARDAGGVLDVAGTTLGPAHRPRFVGIYGHDIDIEPTRHMVFLRAPAQVPGTFGKIGTKMGEFGINISQVTVAPSRPGEPEVMGLAVSAPLSDDQLAQIVAAAELLDAKRVTL